jgi:23S rRNA pseudouridine2605 synthase
MKKQNKYDKKATPKPPEGIRLNRYVANAGICSRREADELIKNGKIKLNGKIVTEMGIKVMPGDSVVYKGKKINPEKKVYILLNKPKDYVTTTSDPEGRKTVMDILKNACKERVFPVGRLDRSTTGVLLITNDGDLAKKLTHPSHKQKKIYQVSLDRNLTKNDLLAIAEGIELEDGMIAADAISYIEDNKSEIGIEIHSGKNRIVRRIFEHLGYDIKKLDRVYFAGLTKKNLPRGKWRFLSEKEVSFLKIQAGKDKA